MKNNQDILTANFLIKFWKVSLVSKTTDLGESEINVPVYFNESMFYNKFLW